MPDTAVTFTISASLAVVISAGVSATLARYPIATIRTLQLIEATTLKFLGTTRGMLFAKAAPS